jgi:hypothetical protein
LFLSVGSFVSFFLDFSCFCLCYFLSYILSLTFPYTVSAGCCCCLLEANKAKSYKTNRNIM